MVVNYQCGLTPTTLCSANRNLNVSKQQMCEIALAVAVAIFEDGKVSTSVGSFVEWRLACER